MWPDVEVLSSEPSLCRGKIWYRLLPRRGSEWQPAGQQAAAVTAGNTTPSPACGSHATNNISDPVTD